MRPSSDGGLFIVLGEGEGVWPSQPRREAGRGGIVVWACLRVLKKFTILKVVGASFYYMAPSHFLCPLSPGYAGRGVRWGREGIDVWACLRVLQKSII